MQKKILNNVKRVVCVVPFLQSLFQIFKNRLKRVSALTAYVLGAAPCSALPTADENLVYWSVSPCTLPGY